LVPLFRSDGDHAAAIVERGLGVGVFSKRENDNIADGPCRIILWIGTKSRQFLPSQRLTNARASMADEILALSPSCVSATPHLKRESSLWPEFGWIPGNVPGKNWGALTN